MTEGKKTDYPWTKQVQGHWRKLPDGTQVWVAPHVRGPEGPAQAPEEEKDA